MLLRWSAAPICCDFPLPLPSRSGKFGPSAFLSNLTGETLAQMAALAAADGLYVNLHTTEFPAGAIRAQLLPEGALLLVLLLLPLLLLTPLLPLPLHCY